MEFVDTTEVCKAFPPQRAMDAIRGYGSPSTVDHSSEWTRPSIDPWRRVRRERGREEALLWLGLPFRDSR